MGFVRKEENVIQFDCFTCGKCFQQGQHQYQGHKLTLYGDVFCCDSCWKNNWDGWSPQYEARLLEHLKSNGLPQPIRNAKGWLPRK